MSKVVVFGVIVFGVIVWPSRDTLCVILSTPRRLGLSRRRLSFLLIIVGYCILQFQDLFVCLVFL
jgi:hypothetical protein